MDLLEQVAFYETGSIASHLSLYFDLFQTFDKFSFFFLLFFFFFGSILLVVSPGKVYTTFFSNTKVNTGQGVVEVNSIIDFYDR